LQYLVFGKRNKVHAERKTCSLPYCRFNNYLLHHVHGCPVPAVSNEDKVEPTFLDCGEGATKVLGLFGFLKCLFLGPQNLNCQRRQKHHCKREDNDAYPVNEIYWCIDKCEECYHH
jgi:hypothetical protein